MNQGGCKHRKPRQEYEATYNFAKKKTFRLRFQTNQAAIINAWRPSIQTSRNATEDNTEKNTITNAEQTSRCHTARRYKHTCRLFKFGLCEDCKATPRKDIKISTPQDEYAHVVARTENRITSQFTECCLKSSQAKRWD